MDGENLLKVKDLNLLRARIGMVFQKPTPFPMSIYDNIAFGIKLYERIPKSEMDGRVEHALTRAALWTEVKDKLAASGLSLSGGQQQRLCIARSVATQAGSDPAGRAVLGAGPDLHRQDRRADRGTGGRLHHRDRHPQYAAGQPRRPTIPPSCIWASWSSMARRRRSSRRRRISGPSSILPGGLGNPSRHGRA